MGFPGVINASLKQQGGGYKVRMCKFYGEPGSCSRGDACTFAHGQEELIAHGGASPMAPNVTSPGARLGGSAGVPRAPGSCGFKSKICVNYQNGVCGRGDACTYAHGVHQLQAGTFAGSKTKICRFFEEQGSCARGGACTFAHGAHELSDGASSGFSPMGPQEVQTTAQLISAQAARRAAAAAWGTDSFQFTPSQSVYGAQEMQATSTAMSFQQQAQALESRLSKTRLCKFFQQTGSCRSGDQCVFAHSVQDLQDAGQIQQSLLPGGQMQQGALGGVSNDYNPFNDFNLPQQQLQQQQQRVQQPMTQGVNFQALEAAGAAMSFRTKVCVNFQNNMCTRGDACTYAHGVQNLQPATFVGAKTKLCKFFEESGSCARGAVCTYAHGVHELAAGGDVSQPMLALPEGASGGLRQELLVSPSGFGAADLGLPSPAVGSIPGGLRSNLLLQQVQCAAPPVMHPPDAPAIASAAPGGLKMRLCAGYETGSCQLGAACEFAHGANELSLGSVMEMLTEEFGTDGAQNLSLGELLSAISQRQS